MPPTGLLAKNEFLYKNVNTGGSADKPFLKVH